MTYNIDNRKESHLQACPLRKQIRKKLFRRRSLKFLFPSLAFLIIFIVFFLSDLRVRVTDVAHPHKLLTQATHIQFKGQDNKDHPFTICAHQSTYLSETELLLKNIQLNYMLENNRVLTLNATEGLYNPITQKMLMRGDVVMNHSDGLTLNTTEATIDIPSGFAFNDVPITGVGDKKSFKSNGFRIFEHGKRIVFLGQPQLFLLR